MVGVSTIPAAGTHVVNTLPAPLAAAIEGRAISGVAGALGSGTSSAIVGAGSEDFHWEDFWTQTLFGFVHGSLPELGGPIGSSSINWSQYVLSTKWQGQALTLEGHLTSLGSGALYAFGEARLNPQDELANLLKTVDSYYFMRPGFARESLEIDLHMIYLQRFGFQGLRSLLSESSHIVMDWLLSEIVE